MAGAWGLTAGQHLEKLQVSLQLNVVTSRSLKTSLLKLLRLNCVDVYILFIPWKLQSCAFGSYWVTLSNLVNF